MVNTEVIGFMSDHSSKCAGEGGFMSHHSSKCAGEGGW